MNAVIAAIGNVVSWQEIDGVIYSLSADAVIRVNDADTGFNVHRVQFGSMEAAEAKFVETIDDALAVAA